MLSIEYLALYYSLENLFDFLDVMCRHERDPRRILGIPAGHASIGLR